MQNLNQSIQTITDYNTLIKSFFKVYQGKNFSGERRINFGLDAAFSDFARFRSDILDALKEEMRPEKFIIALNRLYLLSQTNSDLLVEAGSLFIKQFFEIYPEARELDRLSLEMFEYLHYQVFHLSEDIPDVYEPLEDITQQLSEYHFRNNRFIIWPLYYLLQQITDALTKQQLVDHENKLAFLSEAEIKIYQDDTKKQLVDRIANNANGFCDRNLIFKFLKDEISIEDKFLTGFILSDMLKKLPVADYIRYATFNYAIYKEAYLWEFEKKSLDDYTDLATLPDFKRLVCLVSDIFFIKAVYQSTAEEQQMTQNPNPEQTAIDADNTEAINQQKNKPENQELSVDEDVENTNIKIQDNMPEVNIKPVRNEYLLPVPMLNLLYEEFNDILWKDILLTEFMNVFTTNNSVISNFQVLNKTRFYYFLKKIWINSPNKLLFESEKAWVETFLTNYKLSISSYWNQYVKNEGRVKHREFIRLVDKLLTSVH